MDLLNSTDADSSANNSAGGDSPRQPKVACNEKPVERRHIVNDVVDSDGETRRSGSASPSTSLREDERETRARRHRKLLNQADLVPDDYYIERELPLILNVEPKTYGKRLASSSAQTDSRLQGSSPLSSSAKASNKKRGLLRVRRKNKTQLTIQCGLPSQPERPKSSEPPDSSLETVDEERRPEPRKELSNADQVSLIQDVVTSQDQKWRTCTIQTDSDSLTVNYVTIAPDSAAAVGAGQDDGYVSGSGDLNRQSSFGKGLFGLGFGNKERVDQAGPKEDSKQAQKQRTKSAKKASQKGKARQKKLAKTTKTAEQDESETLEVEPTEVDIELKPQVAAEEQPEESAPGQDESLESGGRSASPNSKELKQRLKLERREKERREKEEKRLQKELEEASAKAEKLRLKQEKEAKKAKKAAEKKAKKTPPSSKPQTPVPAEQEPAPARSSVNVVKFASDLVESETESLKKAKQDDTQSAPAAHEPLTQLDSIQRIIETTDSSYEQSKERLSQEDGHDMVHVSISERLTVDEHPIEEKAPHSTSEPAEEASREVQSVGSGSPAPEEGHLISLASERQDSSEPSGPPKAVGQSALKPILKQSSSASNQEEEEEASAELVMGDDRKLSAAASKLVSEATEEAVRAANDLQQKAESASQAETLAKAKKEAKELVKRQKLEAEEEAKRVKEEAKKAKKAEEELKKLEKAQELEKKQAAKKEKAEQERIKREAEKEAKRQSKEAKKGKKKKVGAAEEEQQQVTSSSASEHLESANEKTAAEISAGSDLMNAESSLVEEKAEEKVIAAAATEQPSEPLSVSPEKKEGSADSSGSSKKKKAKKTKKALKKDASESSTSEPSSSHLSFLERLFGGRKKSAASKSAAEQAPPVGGQPAQSEQQEEKPVILSEMYPSDPDDADGEMILEVNVPESLIKNQQLSGDTAASPTLATTIDETFATSTGEHRPDEAGASKADITGDRPQIDEDDQATLVNMSSQIMETDNDDDEATENVVSQTNELPLSEASIEPPAQAAVQSKRSSGGLDLVKPEESIEQQPSAESAPKIDEQVAAPDERDTLQASVVEFGEQQQKESPEKKSKSQLKAEEKARKELEAKLEKEAKKRAKEEGKERKRQAKEDLIRQKEAKKAAELEAKRLASEEKAAKKLAAKQLKNESKEKKSKKASEIAGVSGPSIVVSEGQVFQSSEGVAASADDQPSVEPITIEDNMTPVNTETEVQQIVEEVVGEDGVITKTTKTIETKYVTLRQEEVRQSERREMSVEDYEKLKSEERELRRANGTEEGLPADEDEIMVVPIDSQVSVKATEIRRTESTRSAKDNAELQAICATPSYFAPDHPELKDRPEGESPKKLLKRQIKLNQKLIKRAGKLAKSEAKRAKKEAKLAAAEIAVCDEAAKEARKELKRAVKETKRATKQATKEHKKMDKIDKKLAKRQKKIEKKQLKLDKQAAKLAKKEAKQREKLAKKEAKEADKIERKASQRSRKSIKLEDIGEPVLKTSSRFSIGGGDGTDIGEQPQMVEDIRQSSVIGAGSREQLASAAERASPASNDIQVEMSLDDSQALQPQSVSPQENDDGQVLRQEVSEAAAEEEAIADDEAKDDLEDEEIDVVNELPQIKNRSQTVSAEHME